MRITEQMKERIIKVASLYLSDKKCTIRDIAKMVGVSKTTAHLDLTIRLKEIDIRLYRKVKLKDLPIKYGLPLEEEKQLKHIG